ncbi:hypothetical protein CR513_32301, partial [Mucuna pruriens]
MAIHTLHNLSYGDFLDYSICQNSLVVKDHEVWLRRKYSLYLAIMTLARFMESNLLMMAIASMPSLSSPYNSAHISMRAVTGILWSSGNKPRSMKHSFMTVLSSKTSKIFWRWRKVQLYTRLSHGGVITEFSIHFTQNPNGLLRFMMSIHFK